MKTLRAGFSNLIALLPWFVVLLVIALMATGCESMTPGNVKAVAPVSDAPRAGNAYLVRGFIGVFSSGIDQLSDELGSHGVNAMVFQDDQWASLAKTIRAKYAGTERAEPIVLIGHSYGADDVVRIARELNRDNIPVDLLITLDPVTPPTVPANVKRCVNLYQSNGVWDNLPWLRGVPLEAEKSGATELANYNIRTERTDLLEPGVNHFNIEKKKKVHREVVQHVTATCPPRSQWATRTNNSPAASTGVAAVAQQASYVQPPTTPAPKPALQSSANPATQPSAVSSAQPPVASGNGN